MFVLGVDRGFAVAMFYYYSLLQAIWACCHISILQGICG